MELLYNNPILKIQNTGSEFNLSKHASLILDPERPESYPWMSMFKFFYKFYSFKKYIKSGADEKEGAVSSRQQLPRTS